MWFWWFIFVCGLLVPFAMIICGWFMWKHTPDCINVSIGYRTGRSMKNTDTWNFANKYCGRLWWKIGWIMLIISAAMHIPFYNSSVTVIGIFGGILSVVQCVIMIVSGFRTEIVLKRVFDENGLRR